MFSRRHVVLVHFKNADPSIEGILIGRVAGHYRIANAKYVTSKEDSRQLDGETWVPRENVLFVQVIG
jgi:hypothetical protein